MIGTIAVWLVSKGIPEKFARPLVIGVGVLAVFSACVALKTCYDNRVISDHEQAQVAEESSKKIKADEKASVQREKDAEVIRKNDEDRKDAIDATKDEVPTDSSLALGCQRLRQQGYKTDKFSECGGR